MLPFGIQPIHIIIILIVALLIFGPSRLPDLGRSLGKALNEFRQGTRDMTETFRDELSKTDPNRAPSTQPSSSQAPPVQPMPAQAPAGQNFCTQCGSANAAGARFCNKCGAQLPA